MSTSSRIEQAALELFWSLWSELGVPGVVRHHARVAIDPEPLIVASPALFRLDARLRDQVYGWCVTHSDRVSASRLSGLVKDLDGPARPAFSNFTSTLANDGNVSWPLSKEGEAWGASPNVDPSTLRLDRPALVRLRLRTLCGVGARSDVVSSLLLAPDLWWSARELEELGYSKRSIAGVLSNLEEGGIAVSRRDGNALRFRLIDHEPLAALTGSSGLYSPNWRAVFRITSCALELDGLAEKTQSVRRVEAHKLRSILASEATRVDWQPPPPTAGRDDAWERLRGWAEEQLTGFASGTTAASTERHVDNG